jgi:hypothetical protein
MKDLLSGKRKLRDDENIALSEECSAILQRKLPPKLKDPGSFTIPCSIGEVKVGRALCDFGGKHQSDAVVHDEKVKLWRAQVDTNDFNTS